MTIVNAFTHWVFTTEYFISALILFMIITFLCGVFKEKVAKISSGAPLEIIWFLCAIFCFFYAFASVILIVCLVCYMPMYIGSKICDYNKKKKNKVRL